jgi:hypothetical protein
VDVEKIEVDKYPEEEDDDIEEEVVVAVESDSGIVQVEEKLICLL